VKRFFGVAPAAAEPFAPLLPFVPAAPAEPLAPLVLLPLPSNVVFGRPSSSITSRSAVCGLIAPPVAVESSSSAVASELSSGSAAISASTAEATGVFAAMPSRSSCHSRAATLLRRLPSPCP
jgi:hypothetical protein